MGTAATRTSRADAAPADQRDRQRRLLLVAVVAAAYAVGSLSAYWFFGAPDVGVAFFPPAGVTLAALVLVERRDWPVVLATAFAAETLIDLAQGFSLGEALGFALANTLEPLVGATLLGRVCPTVDLTRRRDLAWFTLTAVAAGPIVGGLVGSAWLPSSYEGSYAANALHWWAGDALGVLAVGAPIIALARPAVRAQLQPVREVVLILGVVAVLGALVFWHLTQPFVFLVGPVLLWAAFRMGVAGVAASAAVVAVVANVATATGEGPFAALDDLSGQAQLGMTQLFLGVVILTSWFFAVEIHARELATAQGRAERTARDRLARLQALTSSLAATTTVDDVGRVVLDQARTVLAADGVVLMVLDGEGGLRAVASSPPMPPPSTYGSVAPDADLPTSAALRRGQALFYDSLDDLAVEHPDMAATVALVGIASGGALPLRSEGVAVGAIGLANTEPHRHTTAERALAVTVADQVGQALGRARLLERERRLRRREAAGRARAELLADIAAGLEREAGMGARAEVVVERLVPDFADYATVESVRDGEVDLLALAHVDPTKAAVLRELRRHHRLPADDAASVVNVAGRREAVVLGPLDEALIDRYGVAPDTKALLLDLAAHSHLTVPLGTASEGTGVLLLGRSDPARPAFDADDVALAEEVGWRTGLALENARLFEHAREVALRLQQSLLADGLVPAWDVSAAARYDPAVDELEVGGDWYDTIALPDGRIGIAVGDVVGRGLEAAATMGRLRTALAAIAADAGGPGEVLARLDRFARNVTGADCASCCYAELDPDTGELRHASAGHPPALVRRPDGSTTFLAEGRSPLLGVGQGARPEAVTRLDPGAIVVLYSDGLVERRREHLDRGFARLAEAVSSLPDGDLDRFCDQVVDRLTADRVLRDDVVALCVRYEGAPPGSFRRAFGADPGVLAGLRDDLRHWMDDQDVPPDVQETVLVTAGEACANATEHAYLGAEGRVEVVADRTEDHVSVVVRDQGVWRPTAVMTDRGRGTLLMERLADSLSVRSDRRGTEVRLVHRLPERAGTVAP